MRASMEGVRSRRRWHFDGCSREEVCRLIEKNGPCAFVVLLSGDGAGRLGLEAAFRHFVKITRQCTAWCFSVSRG